MHYWNRDYFESLARLAEEYQAREGFDALAEFCRLQGKGLKKQAQVALKRFIDDCQTQPSALQRARALELAARTSDEPAARALLSHPLSRYLQAVLHGWCQEHPDNAAPYSCLGWLSNDDDYYRQALEVDPHDQRSHYFLARSHLRCVDFQAHHLNESIWLGSTADAEQSLAHVNRHIDSLDAGERRDHLRHEQAHYRLLLDAWKAYEQAEASTPFAQWATEQGYAVNPGSLPTAYYYS